MLYRVIKSYGVVYVCAHVCFLFSFLFCFVCCLFFFVLSLFGCCSFCCFSSSRFGVLFKFVFCCFVFVLCLVLFVVMCVFMTGIPETENKTCVGWEAQEGRMGLFGILAVCSLRKHLHLRYLLPASLETTNIYYTSCPPPLNTMLKPCSALPVRS